MDGDIILADDKWHHISDAKHATLDEAEEYQFEGLLDVALPACGMSEEGQHRKSEARPNLVRYAA